MYIHTFAIDNDFWSFFSINKIIEFYEKKNRHLDAGRIMHNKYICISIYLCGGQC